VQACADLGAWFGRAEIMCVWILGLAGLRDSGLQGGYYAGLCRPRSRAQRNRDRVHVWIACVAGLGGMAQYSRDRAGLCKLEHVAQ
jgi:hypothetical protein